MSDGVETGLTETGEPWIGAAEPKLIIEEFIDYQCFQCRKSHFFFRRLLSTHPDKIRIVHRHFPMDDRVNPLVKEPYHRGSGKMAIIAIAAGEFDKFWEANDFLFARANISETVTIDAIAEALEVDERALLNATQLPSVIKRLEKDLVHGIKSGVTGTPTFMIGGQLYVERIPPEIFKELLK